MASGIPVLQLVFSAHAEVVPTHLYHPRGTRSILRACGGSSRELKPEMWPNAYSPRMRR